MLFRRVLGAPGPWSGISSGASRAETGISGTSNLGFESDVGVLVVASIPILGLFLIVLLSLRYTMADVYLKNYSTDRKEGSGSSVLAARSTMLGHRYAKDAKLSSRTAQSLHASLSRLGR